MSDVTATSIVNRALEAIGESYRLLDIDEDTTTGKIVRAHYDDVLRTVLQAYEWNFATARAKIAASATVPTFGSGKYFPLPDGCLQVQRICNFVRGDEWSVETIGTDETGLTRVIYTTVPAPLEIFYTRHVKTLSHWSPMARQVLVAALSVAFAMPITKQKEIEQRAVFRYEQLMADARRQDALEGSPGVLDPGTWVEARW